MEFVGIITKALAMREGVSQQGNPWAVQKFIIEELTQYPNTMAFEVFGYDKINELNLHEGDKVKLLYNSNVKEYNGNVYNEVRAWKAEPYTEEPQQQPTHQQKRPKQTKMAFQEPQQPVVQSEPAEEVDESGNDQLPF